jgi:dephospho-CoA kinase
MLKVGLTGGIGSGKSTVSGILRELGARIIDADVLAREVLEPGMPAYTETIGLFGKRVIGSDGRIDRKALADIVFNDPDKRKLLEGIVHPRVFEEEARLVASIEAVEPGAVVFFDAALLIEAGVHSRMDRVVLVWCRPETQLDRLVNRCGLSSADALLRINAQMSLDEKKRYATHIIDNDGSLDETGRQVRALYEELIQIDF